ncbi:DUF4920 domain-containing protein [Myxococcota bacterium]|nr:DUF4920 domain-containing protein [Myxococcota bacterium]MBU1429692.1 DUF4920 domain-containing protein [Myxococcota bacterium]MBU1898615.1 DUF4920 domain-containing protein [Myxococcota bacterium]
MFTLLLLLSPALFAPASAPAAPTAPAAPAQVFGAGVHAETPLVQISDALASPEKWINQKIRVEGLVVGVCARRGCWLTLAGDKEFETLRVKVTDGEIVFPMSLKGKRLTAEGIWTQIVIGGEAKTCGGGHGACGGAHADGKPCGGGATCGQALVQPKQVFYQLRGLGAQTL